MSVGHLKHGANELIISEREHNEVRRYWPGRDSPELLTSHTAAQHRANSTSSRPLRPIVHSEAKRSMLNEGFKS